MSKVADLRGHTARVLLLLKSPDGSTVASAAADETIRFEKLWHIFNNFTLILLLSRTGCGRFGPLKTKN